MKPKDRSSDEAARDQSRSGSWLRGGLWGHLQPQQEVTCTRTPGQGCLLVHLVKRELQIRLRSREISTLTQLGFADSAELWHISQSAWFPSALAPISATCDSRAGLKGRVLTCTRHTCQR